MRPSTDEWAAMSVRQRAAVASMILAVTQEFGCVLQFDGNEVTVYDWVPGMGAHAHHCGATLYDRMVKALATAEGYAADRLAKAPPGGEK